MGTSKNIKIFLYTLLLLAYQQATYANGFRLPEYTAAGVATANAIVADSSRISAIAYNPAIMSVYTPKKGNTTGLFSANYVQIQYDHEVTNNGKTTQGVGKSSFDVPSLFVSTKISKKLSFGVLANSPFGLETQWPTGTFAGFGGSAALEPKLSRIKMYNVNFNLGYQLNTDTGFAFGVNQYRLIDLQLNSQATIIKGGGVGYGWNAAFISKLTKDLSVGVSYRSTVRTRVGGTVAGALPVEVSITFPEMLSIGVNYAATDALNIEFDVEHTGWSTFDNLNIHKTSDGSTVTKSTNNWKNTLTYRTSLQYRKNKHQFLFGYSYDETPQGDAYYSARIPDTDRQLFTIGYQYDFGSYQFETGLMLVKFKDRTVSSTKTYVPANPPNEPNGTTVYNGTYRADAVVLSVGINTTF